MDIEYEATFPNVNKNKIRSILKKNKANLIKSEFIQKRVAFNFPKNNNIKDGWIRVRDEVDKITMSIKIIDGNQIENQKEICLKIDEFDKAILFLQILGCRKKAYQESKRELWTLDKCEIAIDEWPFLEPYVEIEGTSEKDVKLVAKKLGFDYSNALFCSVGTLYNKKYGVSEEVINNETPEITFKGNNPFE